MDQPRRRFLAGAAAIGATSTLPAQAADTDVMFAVPGTYIPVVGSAKRFQVRRIYCVGRNYAAHAREMGSDPTREPPSSSRNRLTRSSWCRKGRRSTTRTRR